MDFPSNSHASRKTQEEKKTVTSACVDSENENDLFYLFFNQTPNEMKQTIFHDLPRKTLIPSAMDMLCGGLHRIVDSFCGRKPTYNGYRNTTYSTYSTGTPVSYNQIYDNSNCPTEDAPRTISYASRGEAEVVLDQMLEILEHYKSVSVADWYEASGIITDNFRFNDFGWTNLEGVRAVQRSRDGRYVLTLPRAQPLSTIRR